VGCGERFERHQRVTFTDAGAGPLHGGCNPDLQKAEGH